MVRSKLIAGIVLAWLAGSSLAAAAEFPYVNPLQATLIGAIMKARARFAPERIDIPSPVPSRQHFPVMKGRDRLQVTYAEAGKDAPLIFIMTGLGGSSTAGEAMYLADHLQEAGFSSVILPSPFHWRFTLQASRSGYPGVGSEDAQDIYRLMEAVRAKLRAEKGITPRYFGYLGYSLGAIEGVFVAELDAREKRIGLERLVLINPPVDLAYGARVLDSMLLKGMKWESKSVEQLIGYVINVGLSLLRRDIAQPGYFVGLDHAFALTDEQTAFVIGAALHSAIPDVVVASQLVNDRKLLPGDPVRNWAARLYQAQRVPFSYYIRDFAVPAWLAQKGSNADLEKEISLRRHTETLALDPRIVVLHNADDFLLGEGDLAFLQQSLGDRLTVFAHGGHLGNLWMPEHLMKVLSSLEVLALTE